jgi:phosphatidate cytidylyltransferase
MSPAAREQFFGVQHAFDHPLTLWTTVGLTVVLAAAPLVVFVLARTHLIDAKLRYELFQRYYSWLVMVPLMLVPVLLGAFWTILFICGLSLLCYREYARATGLFREKLISLLVVAGIVGLNFAVLDNWYRLFVALTPLFVALIAAVAVLEDRPKGYIQRVALGVLGLLLFGTCLSHLGYFANDSNYRPVLIFLVLAVEANDVFAYIVGKSLGSRKLLPNTSPKKTLAGALGAVVLTTILVVALGQFLYPQSYLDAHGVSLWTELRYLTTLGILVSVVGQLGDLVLSSIKRDLGLKDMGGTIPGHGGLLDRFDSLILVAPAAFHYANYFAGIGIDQPAQVFTGG